jgi:hypothetical protein
MGLRHLIVVNPMCQVVGIITRQDITEHRLHEKWHQEGSEMQKHVNVEILAPGFVDSNYGLTDASGMRYDSFGEEESIFSGSTYPGSAGGDVEIRRGHRVHD